MVDIFISYKRAERPAAERVANALAKAGYTVWWDVELIAGRTYWTEIKETLDRAKAVVILYSAAAADSDGVQAEATYAFGLGKHFPCYLDTPDSVPFPMIATQAQDLAPMAESAAKVAELITAIGTKIGPPARAETESTVASRLDAGMAEAVMWSEIRDSDKLSDFEFYLGRYGERGLFADLARRRLAELDPKRMTNAAAKPARRGLGRRIASAALLLGLGGAAAAAATIATEDFWSQRATDAAYDASLNKNARLNRDLRAARSETTRLRSENRRLASEKSKVETALRTARAEITRLRSSSSPPSAPPRPPTSSAQMAALKGLRIGVRHQNTTATRGRATRFISYLTSKGLNARSYTGSVNDCPGKNTKIRIYANTSRAAAKGPAAETVANLYFGYSKADIWYSYRTNTAGYDILYFICPISSAAGAPTLQAPSASTSGAAITGLRVGVRHQNTTVTRNQAARVTRRLQGKGVRTASYSGSINPCVGGSQRAYVRYRRALGNNTGKKLELETAAALGLSDRVVNYQASSSTAGYDALVVVCSTRSTTTTSRPPSASAVSSALGRLRGLRVAVKHRNTTNTEGMASRLVSYLNGAGLKASTYARTFGVTCKTNDRLRLYHRSQARSNDLKSVVMRYYGYAANQISVSTAKPPTGYDLLIGFCR